MYTVLWINVLLKIFKYYWNSMLSVDTGLAILPPQENVIGDVIAPFFNNAAGMFSRREYTEPPKLFSLAV